MTTSTSGTSMIPAFRNWSASPEPGWTITATVSAASATSVSDWPTPTVSITTMSNAAASACAAARVAGREPAEPLAGGHRADEDAAVGGVGVDPRAVAEQRAARALGRGSTASTATVRPRARHAATSALSSVDLPAPGGPVIADDVRGRLAAERVRRHRREQRRDLRPRRRRAVLDEVERRRGAAREVALAQPRGRGRRPRPRSRGGRRCRFARPRADDVAHDPAEVEVLRACRPRRRRRRAGARRRPRG